MHLDKYDVGSSVQQGAVLYHEPCLLGLKAFWEESAHELVHISDVLQA